jgi:F-type H+-transporting ATPase subunit epsilon
MDKTFQFDLVSPEENVISAPMAHVVIPGENGEMGIGVNHEKFVVALKQGKVKLYKNSQNETPEIIEINGGFADITNDQCTVLAEQIVREQA